MIRAPRRTSILCLTVLMMVAASCATPPDPFDFAMKRIAVDLAFSEDELRVPVPPEVIVRIIPAPRVYVQEPVKLPPYVAPTVSIPPTTVPPVPPDCPVAKPGSAPKYSAQFDVSGPMEIGYYPRRNSGTITVEGGEVPYRFDYPEKSTWAVPVVEEVFVPKGAGGAPTLTADGSNSIEYEIHNQVTADFTVIDRLRIAPNGLVLVKRTTISPQGTSLFEPSPPVGVFRSGTENFTWSNNGADLAHGTAMQFEGKIIKREVIDICGELIDTYQFTGRETYVDLTTGESYGTPEGAPNVYNIATNYNGYIVREQKSYVQTLNDPSNAGGRLKVTYDYVSQAMTFGPRASSE